MKIELDLQSPYTPDGSPRQDLPTDEVLTWDGKEWCNGWLDVVAVGLKGTPPYKTKVVLVDNKKEFILLHKVVRFAPMPTIIEDGNEVL